MSEKSSLPLVRPVAPSHDEPRAAAAGNPPVPVASVAAAASQAAGPGDSPLASQLPAWDLLPPASLLPRKRPAR
jgi:hypothetical protein